MGVAAGILILIIAVAHVVYGEKVQIPNLKQKTDDESSLGSMRVMVYQGGVLLLLTGLLQLFIGLNIVSLSGIAVYFPLAIVSANFLAFLVVSAARHRSLIRASVPQIVIFTAIIVLLVISIL